MIGSPSNSIINRHKIVSFSNPEINTLFKKVGAENVEILTYANGSVEIKGLCNNCVASKGIPLQFRQTRMYDPQKSPIENHLITIIKESRESFLPTNSNPNTMKECKGISGSVTFINSKTH